MSQSPYSIQFLKGTSHNTLEISGNLVINHIEAIYKDLKNSMDFSKKLILHATQIKGIDLTCIQVFLAIKQEFESRSIPVEIKIDLSEEQQHLLDNAGFRSNYFI